MRKIIVVGIIVVLIVVLGLFYFFGFPFFQGDYEYEIPANEWVDITFTQDQLWCEDRPWVLFSDYVAGNEVWVFQEDPIEGLVSWGSELDPLYVELQHILPNIPCHVHSEIAFTLKVERCD